MPDNTEQNPDVLPAANRLKLWFEQPPGRLIIEHERRALDAILPDLFGYHLIQIGTLFNSSICDSTRICHRIVVQTEAEDEDILPSRADVVCPSDALPFAADSMDVVVLPHVLEYSPNPHKLLREIERVLIGEGHLVITGFNPWSLCGLWKLLLAWRGDLPWSGHFFSYGRIKDWFSLLDLEVVRIERSFYRPPLMSLRMLERLSFLEKLGNHCRSMFGGIYIIVVRKRVTPLTPVKLGRRKPLQMIKSGIVEPTARRRASL